MKQDLYNISRFIAGFGIFGGFLSNLQPTTLAIEAPWVFLILAGALSCTALEFSSKRFVRVTRSIILACIAFGLGLVVFTLIAARMTRTRDLIPLITSLVISLICGIWYEYSGEQDTPYVGDTLAVFGICLSAFCLAIMILVFVLNAYKGH